MDEVPQLVKNNNYLPMSSTVKVFDQPLANATAIKILEPLPLEVQNQAAEHIREYLHDLQHDARWDEVFNSTREGSVIDAQRARQEIAKGQAQPMDYNQFELHHEHSAQSHHHH